MTVGIGVYVYQSDPLPLLRMALGIPEHRTNGLVKHQSCIASGCWSIFAILEKRGWNWKRLPLQSGRLKIQRCGDMLRLTARFENDRVAEARFLVRGCTASIAAASALTEWMTGKSRAELKAITAAAIEEAVGGLEPASKHAAVLCVDGVKRLLG